MENWHGVRCLWRSVRFVSAVHGGSGEQSRPARRPGARGSGGRGARRHRRGGCLTQGGPFQRKRGLRCARPPVTCRLPAVSPQSSCPASSPRASRRIGFPRWRCCCPPCRPRCAAGVAGPRLASAMRRELFPRRSPCWARRPAGRAEPWLGGGQERRAPAGKRVAACREGHGAVSCRLAHLS